MNKREDYLEIIHELLSIPGVTEALSPKGAVLYACLRLHAGKNGKVEATDEVLVEWLAEAEEILGDWSADWNRKRQRRCRGRK